MFYLGKECRFISEINKYESLIEVMTTEDGWEEPQLTKIIVSNKYLTEHESSLKEQADLIIGKAEREALTIVEEAKEKRKEIEKEINELQNYKQKLSEKLGDVKLVEQALSLIMMRDAEYYLVLDDYHPRLYKEEDFKDGKELKAVVLRRGGPYVEKNKVLLCVNRFSDASGSNVEVVACNSLNEVHIAFKKLIDDRLERDVELSKYYLELADELKFEDPRIEDFRERQKQKYRDNIIKRIEEHKNGIVGLENELRNLQNSEKS